HGRADRLRRGARSGALRQPWHADHHRRRHRGPDRHAVGIEEARMSALSGGIIVMVVGCFALKYAGLSVPERVLQHPLTVRATDLLPAGLLGALIAVQVFAT